MNGLTPRSTSLESKKTESMVVKFKREKRHNVREDKEVGQIYRELGEESRWGGECNQMHCMKFPEN